MKFEFATAARIFFGPGQVSEALPQALALGNKAFLVTGRSIFRSEELASDLVKHGIPVIRFLVEAEPTIDLVEAGSNIAQKNHCNLVIGFGGGSVLDAAKAIAALATNPGGALEYLEVIGKAKPLVNPPLPIIAIPTTAGTGSEVTRNSVLSSPEKRVKVSLRHPLMLPRVAIVDPQLTYSLPPNMSASTGMDALTQLIEPFLSIAANPITDGICIEGITRAARSLRQVYLDGTNTDAREDMALASLFGGMALANAKLGAVHGFAGPMGGMFPASHGELCAQLLPVVMRINLQALRDRNPASPCLQRFTRVANLLCGDQDSNAEDGIAWLEQTSRMMNIPPLKNHGVKEEDIEVIISQARGSSSMKGNPIQLTDQELESILLAAL